MNKLLSVFTLLTLIITIALGGMIAARRALPGTAGCLVIESSYDNGQKQENRVRWIDFETGLMVRRMSYAGVLTEHWLGRSPDDRAQVYFRYPFNPLDQESQRYRGSDGDLILKDSTGEKLVRSIHSNDDGTIYWSHDSRYFVYTWIRLSPQRGDVATIADGLTGRTIRDIPLPDSMSYATADWSPDNQAITLMITADEKTVSVMVVLLSGNITLYDPKFATEMMFVWKSKWSPSGHRLAFMDVSKLDGGGVMVVIDPEFGNPATFKFEQPFGHVTILWSPNGRWIATTSREERDLDRGTNNLELFSMSPAASGSTRELIVTTTRLQAQWLADSSGIRYLKHLIQTDKMTFEDRLYAYDLASKQSRLITVGKFANDAVPSERNFLVVQSSQGGRINQVILMNEDGTPLKTLGEFTRFENVFFADSERRWAGTLLTIDSGQQWVWTRLDGTGEVRRFPDKPVSAVNKFPLMVNGSTWMGVSFTPTGTDMPVTSFVNLETGEAKTPVPGTLYGNFQDYGYGYMEFPVPSTELYGYYLTNKVSIDGVPHSIVTRSDQDGRESERYTVPGTIDSSRDLRVSPDKRYAIHIVEVGVRTGFRYFLLRNGITSPTETIPPLAFYQEQGYYYEIKWSRNGRYLALVHSNDYDRSVVVRVFDTDGQLRWQMKSDNGEEDTSYYTVTDCDLGERITSGYTIRS